MPQLPDLLRPGLALVFVGYNPSLPAWERGHYYANPRNAFYRLVNRHLLPDHRPLTWLDDCHLLQHGIGITDLVPEIPSRGTADVSRRRFAEGAPALLAKLRACTPRIVCFNGYGVFTTALPKMATNPVIPGLQCARLEESLVVVVPSTSGAASGLSQVRERVFAELGALFRQPARGY